MRFLFFHSLSRAHERERKRENPAPCALRCHPRQRGKGRQFGVSVQCPFFVVVEAAAGRRQHACWQKRGEPAQSPRRRPPGPRRPFSPLSDTCRGSFVLVASLEALSMRPNCPLGGRMLSSLSAEGRKRCRLRRRGRRTEKNGRDAPFPRCPARLPAPSL